MDDLRFPREILFTENTVAGRIFQDLGKDLTKVSPKYTERIKTSIYTALGRIFAGMDLGLK